LAARLRPDPLGELSQLTAFPQAPSWIKGMGPREGEERGKGKKEKGREGGRKEKGGVERFSPRLK